MAEPQAAEAEFLHFGDRLIRRPAVPADAVRRDHYTRAFGAALAVDEHLPVGVVANQLEELRHLVGLRVLFAAPRNADVAHALRFHQGPLAGNLGGLVSQVHDDGDAQLLQFGKAGILRLPAAVKLFVDDAEVP